MVVDVTVDFVSVQYTVQHGTSNNVSARIAAVLPQRIPYCSFLKIMLKIESRVLKYYDRLQ